jgi:hypothetical protein
MKTRELVAITRLRKLRRELADKHVSEQQRLIEQRHSELKQVLTSASRIESAAARATASLVKAGPGDLVWVQSQLAALEEIDQERLRNADKADSIRLSISDAEEELRARIRARAQKDKDLERWTTLMKETDRAMVLQKERLAEEP